MAVSSEFRLANLLHSFFIESTSVLTEVLLDPKIALARLGPKGASPGVPYPRQRLEQVASPSGRTTASTNLYLGLTESLRNTLHYWHLSI
jgi:hypothetical protein